jgi:hypothetical protein
VNVREIIFSAILDFIYVETQGSVVTFKLFSLFLCVYLVTQLQCISMACKKPCILTSDDLLFSPCEGMSIILCLLLACFTISQISPLTFCLARTRFLPKA